MLVKRDPTMHRRNRSCLALLFLWPLLSQADVAEVPELGVKFTDLPSGLPQFQVNGGPWGYEATTHLGKTYLWVHRDDDPVPSGSDVNDSRYRATFLNAEHSKHSKATSLGGHPAWTVGEALHLGPITLYSWLTYVIVDQHLYNFKVSGSGPDGTADFDSLLKGVYSVAFEPIQRAEPAAPKGPKVPRFVFGGDDFYPTTSTRRGEQGMVGIEFSIDGKGRAQQLKELHAPSHDLAAAASAVLKEGVFRVPADWEVSGSHNQRFTMEVEFTLVELGTPCHSVQPAHTGTAAVVRICGTAIRRPKVP
jgi:hypothetical protein